MAYQDDYEGGDDEDQKSSGPRIQPGRYKARGIDGGLGKSKEGNQQVAVRFALLGDNVIGEEITWFGSFSKTLGKGTKTPLQRTIEALRACGWEGDDISDLTGIDTNEVSLVIEHDTYKGKTTAKVAWVNKAGGLALKTPLTSDEARAFAAQMKGEVIAASRSIPKAGTPSNGGNRSGYSAPPDDERGPPDRDDDIPY